MRSHDHDLVGTIWKKRWWNPLIAFPELAEVEEISYSSYDGRIYSVTLINAHVGAGPRYEIHNPLNRKGNLIGYRPVEKVEASE